MPYPTLDMQNSESTTCWGKRVATLIAGDQAAGTFKTTWDASAMPSGVYFYRLTAGEYVQTRKLVLMRRYGNG